MNIKNEYLKLLEIVKRRLDSQGLPAKNEDVGKTLGYKSRTSYQNLLGPRGNITEEHIKQLKLHFPFVSQNMTDNPPPDELNQVLPMGDLKLTVGDYIKKIEENTKRIEEHNAFLQKMLSEKAEAIDQNLKKTLAYAGRISLRVDAASEVALESLARLEKKPVGSLTSEVGKEVANLMKEL
jgi:hypothetical protein